MYSGKTRVDTPLEELVQILSLTIECWSLLYGNGNGVFLSFLTIMFTEVLCCFWSGFYFVRNKKVMRFLKTNSWWPSLTVLPRGWGWRKCINWVSHSFTRYGYYIVQPNLTHYNCISYNIGTKFVTTFLVFVIINHVIMVDKGGQHKFIPCGMSFTCKL